MIKFTVDQSNRMEPQSSLSYTENYTAWVSFSQIGYLLGHKF